MRRLLLVIATVGCRSSIPPAAPVPVPVVVEADALAEEASPTQVADGCATIEAVQAEFEASGRGVNGDGPGGDDHAYPPACEALEFGAAAGGDSDAVPRTPPWSRPVGWCWIGDSIYGPKRCEVGFGWGGEVASVALEASMAKAEARASVVERDVIHGGRPEAIVRLVVGDDDVIAVCRATPRVGCTAAVALSGNGWRATAKVEAAAIVVEAVAGSTPPPGVVGRHPLVFLPARSAP
jgi:hypothetical protein